MDDRRRSALVRGDLNVKPLRHEALQHAFEIAEEIGYEQISLLDGYAHDALARLALQWARARATPRMQEAVLAILRNDEDALNRIASGKENR